MLTFVPPPEGEGKKKMIQILRTNPSRAKFFSRVESHQELIVIVPTNNTSETDMFYWVWLSGRGAGAFSDGEKRYIEETGLTLYQGGWNYQPNIQISLDHFEEHRHGN